MSLSIYDTDIINILWDITGNGKWVLGDLEELVLIIQTTIKYMYPKNHKNKIWGKTDLEELSGYIVCLIHQNSNITNTIQFYPESIDDIIDEAIEETEENDISIETLDFTEENNECTRTDKITYADKITYTDKIDNPPNEDTIIKQHDEEDYSDNLVLDFSDQNEVTPIKICASSKTTVVKPKKVCTTSNIISGFYSYSVLCPIGQWLTFTCGDIPSCNDLVNHIYDYPYEKFEPEYEKKLEHVKYLKSLPFYEQKSQKWLAERKTCITATAVSAIIDEDPYKYPIEILFDKCGRGEPFQDNINTHHGKKYEQIGTMFYSYRNNVNVGEYGLIKHPEYPFIAASPDGICEHTRCDGTGLSSLVGRAIEIKFPKRRKINNSGEIDGDICPHYYAVQVQTQMFVTQEAENDFIQFEVNEYKSRDEFIEDTHPLIPSLSAETQLEKGAIIQLFEMDSKGKTFYEKLFNAKYIYPPKLHMTPEEIDQWIEEQKANSFGLKDKYIFDRVIYWRIEKCVCTLFHADTQWMLSKVPMLKQFWDYIEFYRKYPKLLDDLVSFVDRVGKKYSKTIFQRVHEDYLKHNRGSTYKPLYTEKTAWRVKYENKYK